MLSLYRQTLPSPLLSLCVDCVFAGNAFDNLQTPFHVPALRSFSGPIPQAGCDSPCSLFPQQQPPSTSHPYNTFLEGLSHPQYNSLFPCHHNSVDYKLLGFVSLRSRECLMHLINKYFLMKGIKD